MYMKRLYINGKLFVFIMSFFAIACSGVGESDILNERQYHLAEKAFVNGNEFIILGDYKNAITELNNAYSHFLLAGSNDMAIISALKVHHVYILNKQNDLADIWLNKADKISAGNQNLLVNKFILTKANTALINGEHEKGRNILNQFNGTKADDDDLFEFHFLNLALSQKLGSSVSGSREYLSKNIQSQFNDAITGEHKNPLIVSSAGYEIAKLLVHEGNYEEAISYAKIAHDVDQLYNYVGGLAQDCLLMSNIYEKLNDRGNADFYLLKSKEFYEITGDTKKLEAIKKKMRR
ncbi:MAG: hypothetical protein SCALA702_22690 [Melioribacteraceae bacterium]|nr:MAG: hypothetical protein SCALA702_22690 [Melioribacteraceae bacterium]